MDSKLFAGRAVFNATLMALLAVAIIAAGCVPPKNKMPKTGAITSAPAAVAAPKHDPLSRIWQRLAALEAKSGVAGSITITNAVAGIGEEAASTKNFRRIEAGMEITGQLRKSLVEAAIYFDASPARIVGIEPSGAPETKAGEAVIASSANKGRAEWRMKLVNGQGAAVSQNLRLHMEAPKGMESIEIRIQRFFKKENGDLLNSIAPTPESIEALRLLDVIRKELDRRAKGVSSNVFWLGAGDCESVKGDQKEGQCYPTDASWRLVEKRAAALGGNPWQEKIVLRVSGGAALRKPVEAPKPVEEAKPVETPKSVEEAKPVETPKPVEEAKPVEAPKPVEEAKPVEAPKPVEEAKPEEAPKPVEVAKPVEAPKPAKAPKVPQEPAKKPAVKKDAVKPKIGKEGQKLFDLSDVLGKR